jgi:hypothetical protein
MSNSDEVNRRDLLLVAGAAGVAAAVASAASPAASQTNPVSGLPANPDTLAIKSQIDSSQWIKAKQDLIATKKFKWLEPFKQDLEVDDIVFGVCSGLQTTVPPYDPYQVESLTSSTSSLLDRCLTYRREMQDLEEAAVKRAFEYDLFDSQYDEQLVIELAAHQLMQRQLEQKGHLDAADKFSAASSGTPPERTAEGFAVLSRANAASLSAAVEGETQRQSSVRAKWRALRVYQDRLQDRHNVPGHALNYGDRRARLEAFLRQDISIAFQKLRCVAVGLNRILQIPSGQGLTIPTPTAYRYLDQLVMFLRMAIDVAERGTLEEVEFEHVIPLVTGRQNKKPASYFAPAPGEPSWRNALVGGRIEFILDDKEFLQPAIGRLRMKGIGLSLVCENPSDINARLRTTSAVVFPPSVENFFPGNPATNPRPPLIIEKINQFDPTQTRLEPLSPIYNVDPRGKWAIQLSTSILFVSDTEAHFRSDSNIKDLRLHLKLAAHLSSEKTSWSGFFW